MKHHFYFSGYSDDVVLAGSCKRDFDELYSTFYLMSNGIVIKAEYTKEGWQIGLREEHNADITIIPAVDQDDSGKEHDDSRIPEWLDAPGYAPVCIIESDEPLEIVASSDRMFSDTSSAFLKAARLRKAVLEAASDCDSDECPDVEAFKIALEKLHF